MLESDEELEQLKEHVGNLTESRNKHETRLTLLEREQKNQGKILSRILEAIDDIKEWRSHIATREDMSEMRHLFQAHVVNQAEENSALSKELVKALPPGYLAKTVIAFCGLLTAIVGAIAAIMHLLK